MAVLAAALQTVSAAEITGKITLKGTPKPETPIPLEGTTCGPVVPKAFTTRHYMVGADKGLANVFVYIKQGAAPAPATAGEPLLDQLNCPIRALRDGDGHRQKLKIRNSDPLLHNVHATPRVNKEFNFAQVTKGQINEKAFDKPEVLVRMKCDVHPWMFAYIGVVDHPYFRRHRQRRSFKNLESAGGQIHD